MLARIFFLVIVKLRLCSATSPVINLELMRRTTNNSTFAGALPEFVLGEVWWYWLPPATIFGALVGLFMAWFLFKESRNEEMDKLLETMMRRAGVKTKKASNMSETDVLMITEHWNALSVATFKEEDFADEMSFHVESSPEPTTPYEVLKKVFKDANMNGNPVLDETDFEMALGSLFIAPHELDSTNVFGRLNNGSGRVSVDHLFEAIGNNIQTPDSKEGIVSALKAAILETYSRERRASLSILKNHDDAMQTADVYDSTPGRQSYLTNSTHTVRGNVEMLIRAKTAKTAIGLDGEDILLKPHEFNKLLVSMGVTFSEAYVRERVLFLEALQPDGIDADEFQELLEVEIDNTPGMSKNDAVAKVLDTLIDRHGGRELAEKRTAEDVAMERNGAFTIYNEKEFSLYTPDVPPSSEDGKTFELVTVL